MAKHFLALVSETDDTIIYDRLSLEDVWPWVKHLDIDDRRQQGLDEAQAFALAAGGVGPAPAGARTCSPTGRN